VAVSRQLSTLTWRLEDLCFNGQHLKLNSCA